MGESEREGREETMSAETYAAVQEFIKAMLIVPADPDLQVTELRWLDV
jgi:hypothetical protein